jgi:hypothetical protein
MHSMAWGMQTTNTQSSQFELGLPGVMQGVGHSALQSVGGPPELLLEPLPLELLLLELLLELLPDVIPQAQSVSFL